MTQIPVHLAIPWHIYKKLKLFATQREIEICELLREYICGSVEFEESFRLENSIEKQDLFYKASMLAQLKADLKRINEGV